MNQVRTLKPEVPRVGAVINCIVQDCQHQLRFACERPVIEVNKVGVCMSYVHRPGSQNRDLSKLYAGFAHPAEGGASA